MQKEDTNKAKIAKAKRAQTQRKYREKNRAKLNADKRAKHLANREENLKNNKVLIECKMCMKMVQKNSVARHQRSTTCKRIAEQQIAECMNDMITHVETHE